MKHDARLTEGPIRKVLFLFSLPVLFGNVLQSLNGSVNAIWVGRYLGEAALTATSNANLLMFLLMGAAWGVTLAANILVAQHVGAKEFEAARRVTGTSATFFLLLSVATSIAGIVFTPWLLAWMHTPADALRFALDYLRIVFLSLPLGFGFYFVIAVLRGAGDSRTPFLFLVLCVLLDIGLNPLLIFGIGPFPRMGIAGSATASLIAQLVSLAAMLLHLYRRKHFLCIHRGELALLRIDWHLVRVLVTKGLPMGLQMLVASSSLLVMLTFVNRYGSQTTAAFAAAMQLWGYIQMPALALSASVSSMAAQNVGAGRWDRVALIARTGVTFNFLMSGALILLTYALERPALGLFLPAGAAALDLAVHINAVIVWSFVLFGLTLILFGVVRATGATFAPLVLLFISLWLVRIPLALLLQHWFAVDGLWASFPLASIVSALLAVGYYKYGGWRSARMDVPRDAPLPASG
ncbi:MAG: MATE family efflux transporter [Steroidobacteraceae bacterium]|mgnify:CR=1 FL=1